MGSALVRRTMVGLTVTLCFARPLQPQAQLQFTSLALGVANSCGLTSEGAASCWGDNSFGQIGDGATSRQTRPTPVRVR